MRVSLNPVRTSLPSSQRGVALVITLSFLLISTAIIVAFLLRSRSDVRASASYSASVQSDLLAAGAMDQVVANLLEEITHPSNNDHVIRDGGFQWFEPKDAGGIFPSMLPEIVTDAPQPALGRNTLVKQSLNGRKAFSAQAGSATASAVSTASSSDRRPVSAVRWDLPRLLLDGSGTFGGTFTDDLAPDWVYVAENGQPTTSPSQNGSFKIAGRFAYNVYDIGGLLNVNVGGFRSNTSPQNVATKGAQAFADLTQIPGMGNAVDTLVDWRSPFVDWNVTGDATGPITGPRLSVLDYLRVGATSGWRKNPSLDSGDRGNQFMSRKDLIRYASDNGFADALPFLTHFSVDADAPSFSPNTGILTINTPSQSSTGAPRPANPLLEGESKTPVTAANQSRINPPRYDASTAIRALPLASGDTATAPALPRRFPLSRLALVQTDPSARNAAGYNEQAVRDYFGLQLGSDPYTWVYLENRIKTLDEVAAENREPNFFEILKSVIQVGSLGQSRHPIDQVQNSIEPFANRVDDHIMRIGAAIIDQADADSFPTRIQFNDLDGQTTAFGEIYGVEDLPYLHSMRFVGYGKPNDPSQHWFMAQPSLWNPHNPNRRNIQDEGSQRNFRIRALKPFGAIQVRAVRRSSGGSGTSNAEQFPSGATLSFSWAPSSPNFRQPQGLLSNTYPTGAGLTGQPPRAVHSQENTLMNIVPPPFGAAIGFLMGQNTASADFWTVEYDGPPAQFILEYEAGGSFHPYDRLWFAPLQVDPSWHREHATTIFGSIFSGRRDVIASDGVNVRSEALYMKGDPRSERFIWPSELARFTGPSVSGNTRYAQAEGTSPGWYLGMDSLLDLDQTDTYTALWRFGNYPGGSPNDIGYRGDLGFLSINNRRLFETNSQRGFYYHDNDSIVRRAQAGAITALPPYSKPTTVTGTAALNRYFPQFPMPLQARAMTAANASNQSALSQDFFPHRPIVLNRPFRSVGELAHAFRDIPWKNIDLSFQESGDTGLLDVFTVNEVDPPSDSPTPLVAGKVNLNNAPDPVLRALLNGAAREVPTPADPAASTYLKPNDLDALITRFLQYRSETGSPSETQTGANGPLRNLGEIVGRVFSSGSGLFSQSASFVGLRLDSIGATEDKVRQERLATLSRALADVGTTRTWNFMIDIVAQAGDIPPNGTLTDFNPSSESRWWLFISIDRFTGKILARSVERIVE